MSSLNIAGLVLAALMTSMDVPVDSTAAAPKNAAATTQNCDPAECEKKCPQGPSCPDPAKCATASASAAKCATASTAKCAAGAKSRTASTTRVQEFVPVAARITN